MSAGAADRAQLKKAYESMLSTTVRPYLRDKGFSRDGSSFRRTRGDGPMYDMIGFQASRHNRTTVWNAFFTDAGVGSTDVDVVTAQPFGPDLGPRYLLHRRWAHLVPGLPGERRIHPDTDMQAFSEELCNDVDRVLEVLDAVDSTDALVQWAVAHNGLDQVGRTCRYLVSVGDAESLERYMTILGEKFRQDARWSTFINPELIGASGPFAAAFVDKGILDPT